MLKRGVFCLVALVLLTSVVEAQFFRRSTGGRYGHCGNPNCAMCNGNWGYLPGYGSRAAPRRTVPPSAAPEIASTPQPVVDAMLAAGKLTPADVVYDLGCGDGRFLGTAVKKYRCKALGIEIKPDVAAYAKKLQTDPRILIITGDATHYSLEKATVVVVYQTQEFLELMQGRLAGVPVVISYCHPVPGLDNRQHMVKIDGEDHVFYTVGVADSR